MDIKNNHSLMSGLTFIVVLIMTCACSKTNPMPSNVPVPPEDSIEKEALSLKVMSYNIHRGNPPGQEANVIDLQAIANVIKAYQPDLVALNEVDKYTERSGITLDQAKALGKLTGMHAYFAKAMDHDGGQYGDAVLSKMPIVDSMRYSLPPHNTSGIEPRVLTMVAVKIKDKKILFASTHLDHTGDEKYRTLQANAIVNDILPDLEQPLILAGDLNALPNSNTIGILDQKLVMGCSGNGCPLTFPYNKPDRCIDYIMFSPESGMSFKSYKAINGIVASDHLPLIAEIEILTN